LSIFVERFLLTVLAAIFVALILYNPLKFDVRQRSALLVVIVAAAYFASHTISIRNNSVPAKQTEQNSSVNGDRWAEVHKAMIVVKQQRLAVLAQKGQMGSYTAGSPNLFVERMRDYDLAAAQLRGELERFDDDPLATELLTFLNQNGQFTQWQTQEYEVKFDEFARRVALKSRPK
jgi:hypothetical protein